MRKRWIGLGVLGAALAAPFLFLAIANREHVAARPIAGQSTAPAIWDSAFQPAPVPGFVPALPGLPPPGRSPMHGDGYQSDTHPVSGPFGPGLEVRTRTAGTWLPRLCATFVFRSDGKPVAMCGGVTGFRLVLLDPASLDALATYDLPMRPSTFQALVRRDMDVIFGDSSGGAYLFLDDKDRIVLADSRQVIQRIATVRDGKGWRFVPENRWDMTPHVPHDCQNYDNWSPSGECDMITTVMPGPDGRLWWVTRQGRIGTLDPATGKVAQTRLAGEEIQNAFAVDDRAAYIVSDHAQYALAAGADGRPRILWRHPYDRGGGRKVGSINQGSGTTPTLIGDRYVTFADNADPRINIVVLRRGALKPGEAREICRVPVFTPGASATDNSMIGWGRSIILENNAGFSNGFSQKDWGAIEGGIVRVDIREDESGCDIVWTSPLVSPSVVPKLATGNGIAYFYGFDPAPGGGQDWSIVGLDFRTGRQVVKIPTGHGGAFNNNWGSIALAPDGTLYVAAMRGLIQVRRTGRPAH
ncbi:hypothetical protein [Edaphosphingomonas haloaromaticamans]|uniref:Uncharacterized protein n=1 Tax=Edaphosphingomonas haloaromaticamans TaxID=653954 RepID=A0A1S1HK99_9SPHN|nr:hypothetical protein [Sphingomonas haloaromaticamans]OHT20960.1 hypothetical protein BHE75_02965 [Sphingomonas haloaromaticamans]